MGSNEKDICHSFLPYHRNICIADQTRFVGPCFASDKRRGNDAPHRLLTAKCWGCQILECYFSVGIIIYSYKHGYFVWYVRCRDCILALLLYPDNRWAEGPLNLVDYEFSFWNYPCRGYRRSKCCRYRRRRRPQRYTQILPSWASSRQQSLLLWFVINLIYRYLQLSYSK